MKPYILLFRSINVGGKNIVPMKSLVRLLEDEGYDSIRTYIQSGNVVMRGKRKPGPAFAARFEKAFGFAPRWIAFEKRALDDALRACPFHAEDGKALHFFFCDGPATLDDAKVTPLLKGREAFRVSGRTVYLYAPEGIGRSKAAAKIAALLGETASARNWNTVRKLQEMIDA